MGTCAKHYKRMSLMFLVAVFTVLMMSAPAYAETEGEFTYEVVTGGVRITAYSGAGGELELPDKLGEKPVVEIGNSAFQSKSLTNIIIPNTVTAIGSYAFEDNQLTFLIIPDSVMTIDSCAFRRNNLGYVVIGSGITSIELSVFSSNQLTNITIPEGVINIGVGAFSNNELTSLTIPDTVTSIGNGAFGGNKLTSLTIPDSITSIAQGAFEQNQLSSVTIPDSVTNIENSAFSRNQLTSVTIPDSVTNIGDFAFSYNQLTSLTIGNSVASIGSNAFNSNQLTSVTIPESVIGIGERAFGWNKLTSLTIYGKTMTLGQSIFSTNPSNLILYGLAGSDIEAYAANNGHQFEVIPATIYSVTISPTINGIVTSNKSSAEGGESVLLTILPDSGYVLDTLKLNGDEKLVQQNQYFFYMPKENVVVDATFIYTASSAGDARLSEVKIDGDILSQFSTEVETYNIELDYGTTDIPQVTAVPINANANVDISPATSLPGSTALTVTAEDGETIKIYTINFTVAEEEEGLLASALMGLSIKEGSDGAGQELISSFEGDNLNYSVQVEQEIEAVQIVATPAANTTVKMYLDELEFDEGVILLAEGMNNVKVVVSETDKADRAYMITIQRGAVDECFIATAAFGSKMEPSVVLLRQFRDNHLLTNELGSAFVDFYYSNSPPIAAAIANNDGLKAITRIMLVPVVAMVYLVYQPVLLTVFVFAMIMLLTVYYSRRKHLKQN